MQTLINWIELFMADAPLILQFMFFGGFAMMIGLIIEMVVLSIVWIIQDIKDRPEREKIRAEIDRLTRDIEKSEQDKKEAPNIEIRLYEDLKKYCKDNLIPLRYGEIFFGERTKDASGYISYLIDKQHQKGFGYSISIKKKDEEDKNFTNVWVLAHELGHFRSIEDYKDSSEQGADYEARKLCESFLTQKDLDNSYFKISLYCHTMKLEEMEKFEHINNLMEDYK